jgi:spermidine dehydrogenase
VGIDAVSALDCWGCRGIQLPGFKGLALDRTPAPGLGMTPRLELAEDEDYIYHFPDGNASIARLLVRSLIPGSTPGSTMDDIVTAPVDYGKLDIAGAPVRLRLESTVVRVRHRGDPATSSEVEITYVRDGKASIVRAKQCVLACWNMVIPFMCPEMSDVQKGALAYGAKVPLLYTNVAIRDWTAFQKLGVANVTALGSYYHAASLDYPVTIGGYNCPRSPTEPIVVHLERTPCTPGYPARHQQRNGRQQLLDTPFETIERETRAQLGRMLGPGGFDPARDIVAITANRWPHGYTYEYNSLWDPEWTESEKPCVIGRQRFGRIAIANADAGAYAYTNSAIDQAWRAVNELRATGNHTQSASAPG